MCCNTALVLYYTAAHTTRYTHGDVKTSNTAVKISSFSRHNCKPAVALTQLSICLIDFGCANIIRPGATRFYSWSNWLHQDKEFDVKRQDRFGVAQSVLTMAFEDAGISSVHWGDKSKSFAKSMETFGKLYKASPQSTQGKWLSFWLRHDGAGCPHNIHSVLCIPLQRKFQHHEELFEWIDRRLKL